MKIQKGGGDLSSLSSGASELMTQLQNNTSAGCREIFFIPPPNVFIWRNKGALPWLSPILEHWQGVKAAAAKQSVLLKQPLPAASGWRRRPRRPWQRTGTHYQSPSSGPRGLLLRTSANTRTHTSAQATTCTGRHESSVALDGLINSDAVGRRQKKKDTNQHHNLDRVIRIFTPNF